MRQRACFRLFTVNSIEISLSSLPFRLLFILILIFTFGLTCFLLFTTVHSLTSSPLASRHFSASLACVLASIFAKQASHAIRRRTPMLRLPRPRRGNQRSFQALQVVLRIDMRALHPRMVPKRHQGRSEDAAKLLFAHQYRLRKILSRSQRSAPFYGEA